jgi:hypothetical protein
MRFPRFFTLLFVLFTLGLIGVDQAQGDEPTPVLSIRCSEWRQQRQLYQRYDYLYFLL